MSTSPKNPKLIIVSAPSGAGKTTLCHMLLKDFESIKLSISATTRPRRPQEVDGVHYHFLSPEKFKTMKENSEFAEFAEVHGNSYGTPLANIEKAAQEGKHLLFDIDIQGAKSLKKSYPDRVLSIFILPPSMETLQKRLIARKGDAPKAIETRLQNAYNELEWSRTFQYQIINDDLNTAYQQLKEIVEKECR